MAVKRISSRVVEKGSNGHAGNGSNGHSDLFGGAGGGGEEQSPLHEIAQSRYLNYALSVITSRALPDVRDGMKPVHRRIIYTMWQNGLRADVKHRKSATVVGDVMGRYHPHGDGSIYEALVRMAQPFAMRAPLIDGSGNFGSMDGDPAAAMRYTGVPPDSHRRRDDQRDRPGHLFTSAPTTTARRKSPSCCRARCQTCCSTAPPGIAVGMATNIPPHNLGEICSALLKVIEDPEIKDYQLVANDAIRGPRLPHRRAGASTRATSCARSTRPARAPSACAPRGNAPPRPAGGADPLHHQHPLRREQGRASRGDRADRHQPEDAAADRRQDVSTDDVRIELQLKKDADVDKVMAFLLKHTLLQTNFNVNLTCLIPTDNPEVGRPERLGLARHPALLPDVPAEGRDQASRPRARSSSRSASTRSKGSPSRSISSTT
jgi:DNA gyrase subunit A